jgi:hypothetical protein
MEFGREEPGEVLQRDFNAGQVSLMVPNPNDREPMLVQQRFGTFDSVQPLWSDLLAVGDATREARLGRLVPDGEPPLAGNGPDRLFVESAID